MKPVHLLWAVPFVGLLALQLADQRRHESELAELRSELGAPRPPPPRIDVGARREVRSAPAATPPTPVTGAPAAEPAAPPKPPPMEVGEVRDRLEGTFAKQRPDAQSDEARRTAETRLAAILPATSKLQSLECRTSMCRIETVHEDPESYQQFVKGAFLDPETKLWNAGFFSTPLTNPVDGKLVIVSYLARDGEELPPIAELPAPPS